MYYLYYLVLRSTSDFFVVIVQSYFMYYLYYILLRVSSNFYAVYLYYFADLTQILRTLEEPTQLVPATPSYGPPPFKSQWWRSCSGANGGAPVLAPAKVGPSQPRPINVLSSPSALYIQ